MVRLAAHGTNISSGQIVLELLAMVRHRKCCLLLSRWFVVCCHPCDLNRCCVVDVLGVRVDAVVVLASVALPLVVSLLAFCCCVGPESMAFFHGWGPELHKF